MATSKVQCDGCSKDIQIVGYCKTCSGSLCESCLNCHLKGAIFKTHYLVKSDGGVFSRDITDEKCSLHPEENIAFYCKTHQCTFCNGCKEGSHKNCRRKNLRKAGNFKKILEFEENLKNVNDAINVAEGYVKEHENMCISNVTDFYFNMGLYRKQIIEKIDSYFQSMGEHVEQKQDKTQKNLTNILNMYKVRKIEIQEQLDKLKVFSNAHQCGFMYVLRKTGEPLLENIKTSLQETLKKVEVKKYTF